MVKISRQSLYIPTPSFPIFLFLFFWKKGRRRITKIPFDNSASFVAESMACASVCSWAQCRARLQVSQVEMRPHYLLNIYDLLVSQGMNKLDQRSGLRRHLKYGLSLVVTIIFLKSSRRTSEHQYRWTLNEWGHHIWRLRSTGKSFVIQVTCSHCVYNTAKDSPTIFFSYQTRRLDWTRAEFSSR